MALPNFKFNPYVQPYTGGVSKEFGEAVDERLKTYEAASEFDDVLGYQTDTLLQNVAPFENDMAYAREIMHDTRKNLETRAQKGDYENMLREIKRNARNFAGQVQPLIENQKKYNDYLSNLKGMYEKGDINLDTYSKTQSSALQNYKGLDKNNIQGSYFRGFTPSKDLNVAATVDKFLDGWKASGGAKMIPDGQGGYTKVSWEGASEQEIAEAAKNYLFGDQSYAGYAQTQHAIGNLDRVNKETTEAILAGIKKHGFVKNDISMQWEPEYVNGNKKLLEYARMVPMSPSSATLNPSAMDIFDELSLSQDDATGKVILSPMVVKEGDKYYRFTDPTGNPITKDQYAGATRDGGRGIDPDAGKGFTKIETTADQAETQTREANQILVNMASEKFLAEAMKKGMISHDLLDNQTALNDFLRINKNRYTQPNYLKTVRKDYAEAIKNSKQIYDNKRWNITDIPGAATPEYTNIKDDDILANLTGQSIGILDTDIGGFRKGQKADLNSMLEKVTEDGYKVTSVRRLGPLKFNPYSNMPALSYAMTVQDSDGKEKVVEFAAAIQDRDLQPVQDVYSYAYKGMSGEVPFMVQNTAFGNQPIAGRFRVRMTTGTDDKGKTVPTGFVEVLDSSGKKIVQPGFPQNIPISQFAEAYKEVFAPNLITKYLNPKLRN